MMNQSENSNHKSTMDFHSTSSTSSTLNPKDKSKNPTILKIQHVRYNIVTLVSLDGKISVRYFLNEDSEFALYNGIHLEDIITDDNVVMSGDVYGVMTYEVYDKGPRVNRTYRDIAVADVLQFEIQELTSKISSYEQLLAKCSDETLKSQLVHMKNYLECLKSGYEVYNLEPYLK